MSFDFAANTLQKLTSGPLGPWIVFAVETAPDAAVLAFTFVFLLALLVSLLLWCAGNPKRMLRTVLLLAPIAGLYVAMVVGGVIALFGWPILWLFEQILGLSPDVEAWARSFVKLNYLSIGLVMGTAMAVVILLLIQGIWNEQRKSQRPFEKKRAHWKEYGGRVIAGEEYLEVVGVEGRELLKPHDYGRTSEDYRRVGVIVGSIFAAVPIVAGLFLAPTGLNFSLLIYCGLAAVIMFLIPYGISRSLGWIVDSVISKMQAGTS